MDSSILRVTSYNLTNFLRTREEQVYVFFITHGNIISFLYLQQKMKNYKFHLLTLQSANKADYYGITEILLKVALNPRTKWCQLFSDLMIAVSLDTEVCLINSHILEHELWTHGASTI